MQVVILGSGNTAYVLGRRIAAAGHEIVQVFSRRLQQSQMLSAEIGGEAINHFSNLYLHAGIYLLAVSDGAIQPIADALPRLQGVVVHTAGAVSLNALQNTGAGYGVIYPLQSLRKEKMDYVDIPLLVHGSNPLVTEMIMDFANTISQKVTVASDEQRLKLHTAAVVVSNFTNHLYALAEDFCLKEKIEFDLLQPLIEEVSFRMRQFSPSQMQTGPAIRGDETTIYRHLELLQKFSQLKEMYTVFTRSIQITNSEI